MHYGEGSIEVTPPTSATAGPIGRCTLSTDGLITQPFAGTDTVDDIIAHAARTTVRALPWDGVISSRRTRRRRSWRKEVVEKKKWKYFELSAYKYLSFVEMKAAVEEIARALVDLGVGKGGVFNVYARTSPNWQFMAYACSSISTTIATAYDTLGKSGLTHSLHEPSCVGLFTNAELFPTLLNVLPHAPSVKYIVFDGAPSQKILDSLHAVWEDIKVFSID
ncbi:hypothetical protein BDQ12DRAFT_725915 [Crucibulum laeve]|uniref:AMP-dependent synthetase/ligase domain-containing protein n=1 Tax=Crucibulum laeve TaxID=68775 RepID=A0A5C3LU60_9AGAR|nr:hypothetical protein BDQ12DRAFT_725915 [Crucibulum laeve]